MNLLGLLGAGKYAGVKNRLRRLLGLYIEKTKLTLSERLTLLMGAIMLMVTLAMLGTIALLFFSGAIFELFCLCLPPIAAWALVGAIYVILMVVIYLLRRKLIFDPVARFVSKLIFKEDSIEGVDDTPEQAEK